MSQRINVRVADARRGSSAFVAIVAVLVLIGVGIGGWYWYSTRPVKDGPATTKTAADSVKSFLGDLEESLAGIAKDPTKADESVETIKTLAETDLADLQKQATDAPADVKTKIVALVAEYTPKLQAAADAAYKIPGVKEKLEPLVTQLMTGIKSLGT